MNILLPLKYCLLNCPFNSRSFIYNVCIIDTQYVWLSEVTHAKHASHRKRDSLRSGPTPVRGVTMTMTMTMLYLESYTVLCIVVSYKKIRGPS